MIFDHGCDAFNAFLNAMAISKLYMGSTWVQAIAVIVVVGVFFMATLEQYFTHYFYLPRINAVNEGIVILCTITLISGLLGNFRANQRWRDLVKQNFRYKP